MINVEERSLRAFEKDLFSLLQRRVQIDHGVRHERPQLFPGREKIGVYFGKGNRTGSERFKDAIVLAHFGAQFFCEQRGLHQIGDAETSARGFVAVGRTNTALRRADFRLAFAQLAPFIERPVVGQHKMRAIAD